MNTDPWHVKILRTGGPTAVEVLADTIEDVKPPHCGLADESWFIAQCVQTGIWVALSDAVDQDAQYFETRQEALDYWADVAEQYVADPPGRSLPTQPEEDEDDRAFPARGHGWPNPTLSHEGAPMPANPMKPKPLLTISEVQHLRDQDGGVCMNCGHLQEGNIEPDAERRLCENCGLHLVYGIEEVVLRNWILIAL
jgi:hypothetical protein